MADKNGKVPLYRGGWFQIVGDPIKTKEQFLEQWWVDTGKSPKDLTTLIMNITAFYLSHLQSLDCWYFISMTGKSIYLAIKSDTSDLKWFANNIGYTLQFSIGGTDLISLEPCNKNLYPLRFLDSWNPEIESLQTNLLSLYLIAGDKQT